MLNGIKIEVDVSEYHGRVLYLFGTNDPKVAATAKALLDEGDVFLDIGANYSSIGLSVIEKVGNTGFVHLFEPQQEIYNRVSSAIKNSNLKNVKLHQIALMDSEGELTLTRVKNHSGVATLSPENHPFSNQEGQYFNDENQVMTEIVKVENISVYLPPLIENNPFGVKIDVEGVEPYLLPWLLSQSNLKFIIFEAASNKEQLWELMQKNGLTLYGLKRSVFKAEAQLVHNFNEMVLYHDLVAINPKKDVQLPEITRINKLSKIIAI
jgi:FkbM family methyltransferase